MKFTLLILLFTIVFRLPAEASTPHWSYTPVDQKPFFDIPITYNVQVRKWIQYFQTSGKRGYNYYLTSEDYCPNNKKAYEKGKDCGSTMDDNYTYPVKGTLKDSDLVILRERILLSLKTSDNTVGRKNAELYLTFDKEDHIYIAQRTKKKVLKYDLDGNYVETVLQNLPDNPEFIAFMQLS